MLIKIQYKKKIYKDQKNKKKVSLPSANVIKRNKEYKINNKEHQLTNII